MWAKRLFGLILALALVFSAMPMTAHAVAVPQPESEPLTKVTNIKDETAELEEEQGTITFASSEQYETVPSYKQTDPEYKDILYGNVTRSNGKKATIGSHGCGPTCLAMVTTYLWDEEYTPADAAADFGSYNTKEGSYWSLFEDSAEKLELDLEKRTWEKDEVMKALENGQVVISLQSRGLFTSGGHFIVLTGLNDEGRIMVNDPNGANYTKNNTMKFGFKQGFTEKQIFANGGPYWIYGKKNCDDSDVIEPIVDDNTIDSTSTIANSIDDTSIDTAFVRGTLAHSSI